MTDKEATAYTGISKWAWNEARRKKTLPPGIVVSIPGIRKFYYNADAIDKWLDNLQKETTGQGLRLAR